MGKTRRKVPIEIVRDGLDVIDKDSVVRVGDKKHGAYMFACTFSLKEKGMVTLVSRGRFNSKTLDIVENLKRQLGDDLDIKFSTKTDVNKETKKRVSVLLIEIKKKK